MPGTFTTYQMTNFLRAVDAGRVTQYDRHTEMAFAGEVTEDVTPLMDWALDVELVHADWHPRHSGDSNTAALTEAGVQRLAELTSA